VQVFSADGIYLRGWEVPSWGGAAPDDRPQLTVLGDTLAVTDPLYGRVLAFSALGEILGVLRDGSLTIVPGGVAVTEDATYVTDAHGSQVVVFGSK
jgi:hypothetical protein